MSAQRCPIGVILASSPAAIVTCGEKEFSVVVEIYQEAILVLAINVLEVGLVTLELSAEQSPNLLIM
jgi:hypothetical protein